MSSTDFDEDYDSIPSTDAQIMNSIQDLMIRKPRDDEEDFATYKARMKDLLEQLLLKLEEDVDYQKNLEMQIEDLERDLKAKDYDIERLSRQAKDAIDDCKMQANEMAQEMIAKLNMEIERNAQYKSLLIQLQAENFRLKSDLRIQQYADASVHVNGATAYMTDLKAEVETLKMQLAESQLEASKIKRQREGELAVVLEVVKGWETKFRSLERLLHARPVVRQNDESPGTSTNFYPPIPPTFEEERMIDVNSGASNIDEVQNLSAEEFVTYGSKQDEANDASAPDDPLSPPSQSASPQLDLGDDDAAVEADSLSEPEPTSVGDVPSSVSIEDQQLTSPGRIVKIYG